MFAPPAITWLWFMAPPAVTWLWVWGRRRRRGRMWLWLPVLLEDGHSTVSNGIGFSEGRPVSILVSLVLSESTNIDASILNQSDGLGEGTSISTTPPVLTRCQGKGTSFGKASSPSAKVWVEVTASTN